MRCAGQEGWLIPVTAHGRRRARRKAAHAPGMGCKPDHGSRLSWLYPAQGHTSFQSPFCPLVEGMPGGLEQVQNGVWEKFVTLRASLCISMPLCSRFAGMRPTYAPSFSGCFCP
jgi:hypothetical protein